MVLSILFLFSLIQPFLLKFIFSLTIDFVYDLAKYRNIFHWKLKYNIMQIFHH